jgi:hypothetical protein
MMRIGALVGRLLLADGMAGVPQAVSSQQNKRVAVLAAAWQ